MKLLVPICQIQSWITAKFQIDHSSTSVISDTSISSNENETDIDSANFYVGKDKVSKWRKQPIGKRTRTRKQNIVLEFPGVRSQTKACKTPLECFSLFINLNIISIITECTNIKISQQSSKNNDNRHAYQTDEAEVKAFIGLLLAGSIRSNHQNVKVLWDTNRLGIEIFRITMSFNRFLFLLNCLRFDNIETRQDRRVLDLKYLLATAKKVIPFPNIAL